MAKAVIAPKCAAGVGSATRAAPGSVWAPVQADAARHAHPCPSMSIHGRGRTSPAPAQPQQTPPGEATTTKTLLNSLECTPPPRQTRRDQSAQNPHTHTHTHRYTHACDRRRALLHVGCTCCDTRGLEPMEPTHDGDVQKLDLTARPAALDGHALLAAGCWLLAAGLQCRPYTTHDTHTTHDTGGQRSKNAATANPLDGLQS
ncbi:uncharacterized protein SETTUDRAFT_33676 [Exserohilum turcica Et28A]|uniref:Uncharacterized protein n=1 Tax=Exserohilum turcicum (strain 28A) TaxID=671987 RepID=R0IE09_EXST2|nr:uncharacterized protein SETTUDRAFT_33676 [Exserohilum turcica Et28A]EOA83381.1 hypothetical protein SETTUDRAFT_33676 [Exserohilum turcica Et28A]